MAESIQRYAQEAPESVKLEWLRERETQRIRAGGMHHSEPLIIYMPLTGLGSLNPPEGSTSTLSSPMATRGKNPMALPAPPTNVQYPYEIQEMEDERDVEMVER